MSCFAAVVADYSALGAVDPLCLGSFLALDYCRRSVSRALLWEASLFGVLLSMRMRRMRRMVISYVHWRRAIGSSGICPVGQPPVALGF